MKFLKKNLRLKKGIINLVQAKEIESIMRKKRRRERKGDSKEVIRDTRRRLVF